MTLKLTLRYYVVPSKAQCSVYRLRRKFSSFTKAANFNAHLNMLAITFLFSLYVFHPTFPYPNKYILGLMTNHYWQLVVSCEPKQSSPPPSMLSFFCSNECNLNFNMTQMTTVSELSFYPSFSLIILVDLLNTGPFRTCALLSVGDGQINSDWFLTLFSSFLSFNQTVEIATPDLSFLCP